VLVTGVETGFGGYHLNAYGSCNYGVTMVFSKTSSETLYDTDYLQWIETTIDQLRSRNFDDVDWDNLIEELEDMASSQRKAVRSNLKILLLHLLKYRYQPEKRIDSWRFSIVDRRQQLQEDFEESPSLRNYGTEIFSRTYQDARKLAAAETGLAIATFPVESPFTWQDAVDSEDFPT